LLGAHIQKKLGSKVHTMPGADMKAAIREAEKINATVYLIDRPIQKTLQRMSKIPLSERLKLLYFLTLGPIFQRGELKKINLRRVPEEKAISEILKEFKKQLPATYKILIKERNEILAQNINFVRKANPNAKILVIIGAGHVKDVEKLLKNKYKIKNLI
jgi:pheromone shutdown protein TraB